jgi:hypothetical protein
MCGLFGWSFSRQPKKATIRTLAVALMLQNDLRGGDSWGWFAPKTDTKRVGLGNIGTMKRSMLAHMVSEPVVIGHTRKATKGSISKQNCHPFDIGRIIGAHNGMVYNHEDLNKRYNRDCNVDSEHIFHHLQDNEDLQEIETYGAILYHSRDNPTCPIYFGRFNDGDLALARVDGGLIWSSSKRHLQTALQVSGFSAKVEEPDEGILFSTVGLANGTLAVGELNFDKPFVSYTDWRSTGCSYRPWQTEPEEDPEEKGFYWDNLKGKFIPYTKPTESLPMPSGEEVDAEDADADAENVNLTELTEADLEELANASSEDTFSLVNLNEKFEEKDATPIRITR